MLLATWPRKAYFLELKTCSVEHNLGQQSQIARFLQGVQFNALIHTRVRDVVQHVRGDVLASGDGAVDGAFVLARLFGRVGRKAFWSSGAVNFGTICPIIIPRQKLRHPQGTLFE